jgi:carboxymethylenebutenolidase
MTGIETSTISVADLSAYLARPAGGGSDAGVLLLPMITGIGDQLRDWADALADTGITALAWDPFHGRSTDNSSREELSALLAKLDDETALQEQTTLVDHLLGELGCTRVGTIGWCLGGRFALLLAARDSRLVSAVAYHPVVPSKPAPNHTLDPVAAVAGVGVPVMVLYPSADSIVSVEAFGLLQTALQSRAAGATITHFYPGAEHGFADRSRHGNEVNAAAFKLSWPQVLAFLQTTTVVAPGHEVT